MSKAKVLLIDDDASLRRVMEYTLQQAGYQVLVAADGSAGLELFAKEVPPVVITDVQMPGESGYEVLRRIKSENPRTQVIVITAYGTVEKAVEAMKLGASDYLTKPFGRDELKLLVARALTVFGLEEENRQLRQQLEDRVDFSRMIGISDAMHEVFALVRKVAASDVTVLLSGESGTGKELVARALHQGSVRNAAPFVAVNCAAIPTDLLESELFGHVRGAFTGAVRDRLGTFERAEGGTLFLDEVGELPLELQPKLLRALQEKEIEPVGGRPKRLDVRVVAATNRHLEEEMRQGRFREDLYYRLAVIPIHLPPLRQRREDIPLLIRHLLQREGLLETVEVAPEALTALSNYLWPGNVRELENALQRLLLLRQDETIRLKDLPEKIRAPVAASSSVLTLPDEGYSLEALEKEAVEEALRRCDGNQSKAAQFLRIPRHVLLYRLEKYGLRN
ncbi:MAG: DNA-binding response regulator [Desulfuromonas sp.]|nr:MAG: DNA-binding response regulator [Desulfuromonas sp.]